MGLVIICYHPEMPHYFSSGATEMNQSELFADYFWPFGSNLMHFTRVGTKPFFGPLQSCTSVQVLQTLLSEGQENESALAFGKYSQIINHAGCLPLFIYSL